MFIMNYQLTLPRVHDMNLIRERIATIGSRFDTIPGLGAKAFLVREQGVNGSPVNQYAPFYLWTDEDAAAHFLWRGPEFDGVVGAYGRPIVQTWVGGGYARGPALAETPTWAVRSVTRLPADVPPAATAAAASIALEGRTGEAGLHSAAFGIDPRTWELLSFSMHTTKPDPGAGELYEIGHLSAPDEARL